MATTVMGSKNIKKIHAFKLRAVGYSNERIALELGMKASTVQTYFSRRWKSDYEQFEQEGLEHMRRKTLLQLCGLQVVATEVLQQILCSDSEKNRLKAAEILLRAYLNDRF